MHRKKRLNNAVDYAIQTSYETHNRAIRVQKALYSCKNICVFGTGEFFDDCADLEHLHRFEYVGDNNSERWGKRFKGRLCLSPKEIAEMENIAVLIMVGEWRPIYEQLISMGIECYPMDWYSMNVYDPHYDNGWFENNRNNIIDSIDLFEDDRSKDIYVEVICNRIAPPLATKIFNELKTQGEYFSSDIFSMGSNEYMVDAGAYKGDSIEKFLKVTHGKFGAIYSFEMDSAIFCELEKTADKYDRTKIQLINAGVSDEITEMEYGYVQGEKQHREQITTMDMALKGKKVTFIKMDVESFELKALEGARHIIVEQRPKLSISAYHYLSDLWEIPRAIKNMVPEYQIYLRHHAPTVWDTDCYAYVK